MRRTAPHSIRIVVNVVGDDVHGRLAESRFVERPFLYGGELNLYQFAFAAAALGYDVELRGWLDRPTFDGLAASAGVQPRVDLPARKPHADDLVVVPEGWRDQLHYARLYLSEASLALYILAAPGLFGWPFVAGRWKRPDPITVSLDQLALPQHFQGMAALGFRLVTHSPGIVAAAQAAGVSCAFIGTGRPGWTPPPVVEKVVDVAAILDNRWAPLVERVLSELNRPDGPTVDRIETVSNAEMMARLARARVLVWPSRVEGHATIPWEARSVGCVPVALGTNRFAVGVDEAHGAVVVDELGELAPAIVDLLADRARWKQMSQLGRETAPSDVEWGTYVGRVREFLSRPMQAHPSGAPLAGIGAALDDWVTQERAALYDKDVELAVAARDLAAAAENQQRLVAELGHWRALHDRLAGELDEARGRLDRQHAEIIELRVEMNALATEKERLADNSQRLERELGDLLARRSVQAALRVADTMRGKRR